MKKFYNCLVLLTISFFSTNATIDLILGSHLSDEIKQYAENPTPWLKKREHLMELVKKGGVGAEIGVAQGLFSVKLLKITVPQTLYLIDCWQQQEKLSYDDDNNVSEVEQNNRYEFVKKKFEDYSFVKVVRAYSVAAASNFPDEYFDWIYLDGNHTYQAVSEDLNTWFPKIKKGGFICGHDYMIRNVPGARYGVVPAVNEFVKNNNLTINYLTNEPWATYAIRKE